MNYYNENDKYAARWLENLISKGLIPNGHVDDRDIRDLRPGDLAGYTQCHFFAGIGGWSLALELAGWPSTRPVWTGSCPCQPFSLAGKRAGESDDRHLWPEFARLIGERRPASVFGEQVASPDGRLWLSGVRVDLERMGYAVGAADLCAAGIGAPHIRQRLYFGAQRLGYTDDDGRKAGSSAAPALGFGGAAFSRNRIACGGVGYADGAGRSEPTENRWAGKASAKRASFYRDAQWSRGTDDKWRCVKPGIPLLVDGLPREVAGMLAGFGNAIVPPLAAEFVSAFGECAT